MLARPIPALGAVLLRRSWGIDALRCPKCAGRMELVAVVDDEAAPAARGLPDELQPRRRALYPAEVPPHTLHDLRGEHAHPALPFPRQPRLPRPSGGRPLHPVYPFLFVVFLFVLFV
jgi:hypothetical protein